MTPASLAAYQSSIAVFGSPYRARTPQEHSGPFKYLIFDFELLSDQECHCMGSFRQSRSLLVPHRHRTCSDTCPWGRTHPTGIWRRRRQCCSRLPGSFHLFEFLTPHDSNRQSPRYIRFCCFRYLILLKQWANIHSFKKYFASILAILAVFERLWHKFGQQWRTWLSWRAQDRKPV